MRSFLMQRRRQLLRFFTAQAVGTDDDVAVVGLCGLLKVENYVLIVLAEVYDGVDHKD